MGFSRLNLRPADLPLFGRKVKTEATAKNWNPRLTLKFLGAFLLLNSAFFTQILAQKKSEKVEACGSCAMGANQTLKEVQQCALEKAMEEALNRAGIPLEVNSSTQMQQSEGGNGYTEAFSKVIQTRYKGGITEVQDLEEPKSKINEFKIMEIERCIRASVVQYKTDPDPAFTHDVKGILPAYPYQTSLSFRVQSPGSYMLAYYLEGDSAFCFYPNEAERQDLLESDAEHLFPSHKSQREYVVENTQPKAVKSIMLMFFKKPMPTPPVDLRQDLQRWLDGIEPSERQVFNFPIILDSRK